MGLSVLAEKNTICVAFKRLIWASSILCTDAMSISSNTFLPWESLWESNYLIHSLNSGMVIQAFPWLRYATGSLLSSAPFREPGSHSSRSSELSPSLPSRSHQQEGEALFVQPYTVCIVFLSATRMGSTAATSPHWAFPTNVVVLLQPAESPLRCREGVSDTLFLGLFRARAGARWDRSPPFRGL